MHKLVQNHKGTRGLHVFSISTFAIYMHDDDRLYILSQPQTKASLPVSAHSAILMDQESGRVIYEENAHEKSRIASITKIMTAILAIESGKLDKR